MKFIHVSDLHIGKSIYGLSMLDNGDQRFWIDQFLELVRREEPQAVLISGDVYDRASPSREAIEEVDYLLTALRDLAFKPAVMMIAGNHDSGSLVGYLQGIAAAQNIYVAGTAKEKIQKVTLEDECGPVDFWLVPYVFPAIINALYETDIHSYEEAFRSYLEKQDIDFSRRNVILSHQNVTAGGEEADRGGSETMVGGVGGIDYSVFDGFEYAALGHIHAAQSTGRKEVRYAGSPLCYHFDELKHPEKGPVVVTLSGKGAEPEIRIEKIRPLHPMREVRGTLEEIEQAERGNAAENEFIRVVIVPDEAGKISVRTNAEDRLRALFKAKGSILLDTYYEPSKRKAAEAETPSTASSREKTLIELFTEFWQQRRGDCILDEKQRQILEVAADQSENADRRISLDPKKLSKEEKEAVDAIVRLAKQQEAER